MDFLHLGQHHCVLWWSSVVRIQGRQVDARVAPVDPQAYSPKIEMMAFGKMRACILLAVFTVTASCATFYSTICTSGLCLDQQHQSSGHDCEHCSSADSGSTHHRGSGCSFHHHSSLDLVKVEGPPQFRPTGTWPIPGFDLLHKLWVDNARSLNESRLSHLASPPTVEDPLYQRVSVLRI